MPGPSLDVLVVGSANLDVVVRAERHPAPGETLLGRELAEHPGGKGLNQAVAAARSGARTGFVGALGDDAAGRLLGKVLESDAIDASHVKVVAEPTGRALIVVADDGENTIVVAPGANATVVCPTPLPPAAVVLAQLELPLDTVMATLRAARAAGSTTVLNPAPAAELADELLALVDIVVPNEHEAELLGGPARLLAGGSRAVVVTRGGAGVDVHTATGVDHVPPHPVDPVDTTGAGDAFCGSLCARLAAGDDLAAAVKWAAVAGALATTVSGAVPGQPTADAIRDALDS
ncbi:MAG TPA: ribokinase [Ilumatobacter sp.]|nr:ribokinase [Ilumatobacter sp.]